MIELKDDSLVFRFPEVHARAELRIDLQRTLRIPDDSATYPLPPGLGSFPMRHVDDHADRLPASWKEHGGVMLPIHQAEALWIDFDSPFVDGCARYPFLVKIGTGKINAVTGETWDDGVHRDPQNYVVIPEQPWLDGYCVAKDVIRQFVAMPLGDGYTAEEQITGEASWGGLQIAAYPMKAKVFRRRFGHEEISLGVAKHGAMERLSTHMGLAPGGRMRQQIFEDPYDMADWDLRTSSRCFVHLANAAAWREITGQAPPPSPITAEAYTEHGLPWFDHYADAPTVDGSGELAGLKTVSGGGRQQQVREW